MRSKIRVAVLGLVLLAVPFATPAPPANADNFRECDPGEVDCQCGLTVDPSRGWKNAVSIKYC